MNGLYSQAILQQQAMNSISNYTILKPVPIKLKPNTKVSVPSSTNPNSWNNSTPVVDKTPQGSTIPSIYTTTATTTSSTSSSSSGSIFSTISTDFSKYFDYILVGGIVIFVFYMFSGSSSKPQKFVDIEILE